MRKLRSFVRASVLSVVPLVLSAGIAFAQEGTVVEEPGFCAPWHRCMGLGFLIVVVATIGLFALGWLIQSRGFARVEHRQGNPEGVKVDKA